MSSPISHSAHHTKSPRPLSHAQAAHTLADRSSMDPGEEIDSGSDEEEGNSSRQMHHPLLEEDLANSQVSIRPVSTLVNHSHSPLPVSLPFLTPMPSTPPPYPSPPYPLIPPLPTPLSLPSLPLIPPPPPPLPLFLPLPGTLLARPHPSLCNHHNRPHPSSHLQHG